MSGPTPVVGANGLRSGVTPWRAPFRVTGGLTGPSGPSSERMRSATTVACSIEEARPERESTGPSGPSSERMRSATTVACSIEEARPEREARPRSSALANRGAAQRRTA